MWDSTTCHTVVGGPQSECEPAYLEASLQILGIAAHVKVAVAAQCCQNHLALTSLLAPTAQQQQGMGTFMAPLQVHSAWQVASNVES